MKKILFLFALCLSFAMTAAQESPGHSLAIVDAGQPLNKDSAQVKLVEDELKKTANHFKTDEKTASNLIWYHVKAARQKGAAADVVTFMKAARSWSPTKELLPLGSKSLNFFGAVYQTTCCNK